MTRSPQNFQGPEIGAPPEVVINLLMGKSFITVNPEEQLAPIKLRRQLQILYDKGCLPMEVDLFLLKVKDLLAGALPLA